MLAMLGVQYLSPTHPLTTKKSLDLDESHKSSWPWLGGGGPDPSHPWTPRPAPRLNADALCSRRRCGCTGAISHCAFSDRFFSEFAGAACYISHRRAAQTVSVHEQLNIFLNVLESNPAERSVRSCSFHWTFTVFYCTFLLMLSVSLCVFVCLIQIK